MGHCGTFQGQSAENLCLRQQLLVPQRRHPPTSSEQRGSTLLDSGLSMVWRLA